MSWIEGFRRYVRMPARGTRQIERAIHDELRFHLDMRAKELTDAGLSADHAAAEAVKRFGNLKDARAYCREQDTAREGTRRWTALIEEGSQDAVIAYRQLRRAPLFATAALLTLALGISANTAIYSLVNAYLVRPFPFPNDDRIASVIPGPSRDFFPNAPNLQPVDWKTVEAGFEATVAWDLDGFTVVGEGEPEYVDGAWVSPGYFDVLGIRTSMGRGFSGDDYRPGARVALISYDFWTRRYARSPGVIGQTVRMYSTDRPTDPQLVTIVGVMPENTWHLNRFTDVLRPLTTPRMPSLVRLRTGTSLADAERRLSATVRAQLPSTADPAWHMSLVTLRDEHTHQVRPMLLALGASGVLLLLLTCANVAGLIAARGAARRREISLRAALGAGRGRLARQLLVESAVLTLIAGVMGLGLAQLGIQTIARTVQSQLGVTIPGGESSLRIDGSVLTAVILACALVVLLIGARNAFVSSRSNLGAALRIAGAGSGAVDRGARTRILTVQIALAFTLLLGAGLTLRSAVAMADVPLGFDPAGVIKAHVLFPVPRYPEAVDRRRVMTSVLQRIGGDPNVSAVAAVFPHPFRGAQPMPVGTESSGAADRAQLPQAVPHTISNAYFDVVRIPLLAGRAFGPVDTDGPATAIVSADLAQRLWPGVSALGRRIRVGDSETWRTVVGVVREVRKTINGELLPDVYVPFDQSPRAYTAIVARGRGAPEALAEPLRAGLAAVDAALAPSDVAPLADAIANETARPRALAKLLTGFAIFAVVLAALGLGGAVANIITQRKRELAVRMAIGATGGDVVRLLLGDAARVIAIGLAIGVAMAFGLGRILSSQLYRVKATDPATYVVVAAVLACVGLLAAALPGMRATRIDPATVLRDS